MGNFSVYQALDSLEETIRMSSYDETAYNADSTAIVKAIAEAARENGMAKTARDAGMTRAGLYKALSEEGNPSFLTIWNILAALGYRLMPVRISREN